MRVRSTTSGRGAQTTVDHHPGLCSEGVAPPRIRVLIVDDDLPLREMTALFLDGKGYACAAVGNATEAVRCLENETFDLVITDLHMPGMDGMALLEWVKQHGSCTKVMMITGDPDPRAKGLAHQHGVAKYVVKPFVMQEFLRAIKACLQAPAQPCVPWPAHGG